MFALNETAVLYPREGQSGGRPAYAARGEAFRCRSEAEPSWTAGGDSVAPGGALRVFARNVDAHPGDRVELGGASYRIAEVKRMRGFAGIHHLEILARAEHRAGEA